MIRLSDVLDETALSTEISNGRVAARKHPSLPLTVLNYTAAAQYEGHSDVTRACRGLVVDDEGVIVARPLPKFYNYNEPAAPQIAMDDEVFVMDKADGSLIVGFLYGGRFVCCSRGSFVSDQATAAQRMLDDNEYWSWLPGVTYLFELVGPGNRIVLDYPNDELIFLGGVEIDGGEWIAPDSTVATPFRAVETFAYRTFGEALSAPPRKNAEGYVIVSAKGMVKIKQEDYIEIHRLVFGLTEKKVWEHIFNGTDMEALKAKLPEEFQKFIDDTREKILMRAMKIEFNARTEYAIIMRGQPKTRKDFALKAAKSENSKYLFALHDGKDISKMALLAVKDTLKEEVPKDV